jgi:NAD+ synthase (glutamine-hydrolysing)
MTARFYSLYCQDFIRMASGVPRTRVADVSANLSETIRLARQGDGLKAAVMIFPELGLSAYSIDDLLFQDALLDAVEEAIRELMEISRGLYPVLIVGAPIRREGQLFNAAVAIHRGSILGVVPKSYLPNYREFYERRHFASGAGIRQRHLVLAGVVAPFGVDLLFQSTGSVPFTFHIEICEDFWAPLPPSTIAALAGAEILINLSASNVVIGKADTRRLLCASQSARAIAATRQQVRVNQRLILPGTARRQSSNAATGSLRASASPAIPHWSPPMSIWGESVKSGGASIPSEIVHMRNRHERPRSAPSQYHSTLPPKR